MAADITQTLAFLETLYAETAGYIETRCIVDRATGEPRQPGDMRVRRAWSSPAELGAALPRIIPWARDRRCAVFFGVLPRLTAEGSKAEDVAEGCCLWADLDWKDYPSEEAARAQFASLEHPPSIVVRSAHGVHLYWLLSEPNPPGALSALSRRLAAFLGADACHDAARLLRLPGSFNCKDPAGPVLVEIEAFKPGRRYHAVELDQWIPQLPTPQLKLSSDVDVSIPGDLTETARSIIEGNQQVRAHFRGEGKSKGDTSSSGYDWTLAYDILKHGGTVEDAASAVASRPGGLARAKGHRHIERTVGRALSAVKQYRDGQDTQTAMRNATERIARRALKKAEAEDKRSEELAEAWRPDSVQIYLTDPPIYVFTVKGKDYEIQPGHVVQRHQMRRRLLEILQHLPTVPSVRGGAYDAWVNELLEGAKVYEQPPEASRAGGIGEELAERLEGLRLGDCEADLARGCAIEVGERRAVRLTPLLRSLRQSDSEITRPELARHLSRMGWKDKTIRVDGKQIRVWLSPAKPADGTTDWDAAPPTA